MRLVKAFRGFMFPLFMGVLNAQSIVGLEYYIDSDPGYGLGTAVTITQGVTVDETFDVDLTGESPGFHTLFIRVQDEYGSWSITNTRSFYIKASGSVTATNVTGIEHYIDSDPGYGLGTAVTITQGVTIDETFDVDLTGESPGFHSLFIRVQDEYGSWSITNTRTFYIKASGSVTATNITGIEYYFDSDPGYGLGTAVTITQGVTIDQSYQADLTGLSPGFHTLFIRVQDEYGSWSITNTRSIYIQPSSSTAPPANIASVHFNVSESGVQGVWQSYSAFTAANDVDLQITSTAFTFVKGKQYILHAYVKDADGLISLQSTTTPFQINTPPVAVVDSVTAIEDTPLKISVLVNDTDVENDSLSVTATLNASSGVAVVDAGDSTVTFTPATNFNGQASFDYIVSDNQGGLDTARVVVTVSPVNDPPVFTGALPDTTFAEDDSLFIAFSVWFDFVADPDHPDSVLLWSIAESGEAPSANDSGITLTALKDWHGKDTLSIIASDGTLADTTILVVTVTPVNDPPVITSAQAVVAVEDMRFKYLATATDIEDSTLAWTFTKLPSWLLAAADSVFGVPLNGTVDTVFWAIVSDGELKDTLVVTVNVTLVNDPPTITSAQTVTAVEDVRFKYLATATDPEGSTIGWTFTKLPSWLSAAADSVFGVPLNGTVDTSFMVIASDGQLKDTLVVTVNITPVNDPPTITSAQTVTAVEDVRFKYLATATDPEGNAIGWTFTKLPSWLSAAADSVFGVPLNGTVDTSFMVIASDGQLKDTLIVTVNVTSVNDAPTIVSADTVNATEDIYFVYHALATDVDSENLIYSFNNLPTWLSSAVDSVFGTPLNGNMDTSFQLIASDGSLADTQIVVVKVTQVNDPPEPFALLQPANLATILIDADPLVFKWNAAKDVDSKNLTYIFQLMGAGIDTLVTGLTDTVLIFTKTEFFATDSVYLWYADASDGMDTTRPIEDFTFTASRALGLDDLVLIPDHFALHQNYPNPFNPTSTIRFDLPEATNLELVIYDLRGRAIVSLSEGSIPAGYHRVVWNGRDRAGRGVPSGVYIARLLTPDYTKSIKMVLLK